jgi:hypothetical protein
MSTVSVDAISFQTDRTVLPLVIDGNPVISPEWVAGLRSLPAAFAGPDPVEGLAMTVRLSSAAPAAQIKLKATATTAPGSISAIGDIGEVTVDFAGGTRATIDCRATLSSNQVACGCVEWRWQFNDGGEWQDAGVSKHQMAITLALPTAPWTTRPGIPGRTLPWWEVVHLASKVAAGSTTLDGAATKVTEHTFGAWEGKYRWENSRHYATNGFETPARFDCASFLRLLDGERLPDTVDCADQASVVSTFANVLGCNLQQVAISRSMTANPVLLVGNRDWRPRDEFGVHEFTVTGDREEAMIVWDGCLHVSSNDAPRNPTAPPDDVRVPAEMPAAEYLSRLIFENTMGIRLRGGVPDVRPIGPLPSVVRVMAATSVAVEAPMRRWRLPPVEQDPGTRIEHVDLTPDFLGPWHLVAPTVLPDLAPPSDEWDKVVRTLWRSTDDPVRLVSCEVYICRDTRAAHLRTYALLGEFAARAIERIEIPESLENTPEYRFAFGDSGLIDTFLNVVLVVRSATRAAPGVDPQVFSRLRDQVLRARLPPL